MREKKIRHLKQYRIQQAVIKRFEQLIILYPEKKDFYFKKIKNAKLLREKIESQIESVENPVLKELLYHKYIFGKTLEEIALILNYSKRHIERLHVKALEKFNL